MCMRAGYCIVFTGLAVIYLEKAKKNVPMGTHGSLMDITKALDYLMENTFVNGETLFVDGGG